jgi:hypothetical protein
MMWWFPPALLVATGLLSLAWTAFLLFEITKAVELVVQAAASLSASHRPCGNSTSSRHNPTPRFLPEKVGRGKFQSSGGHSFRGR